MSDCLLSMFNSYRDVFISPVFPVQMRNTNALTACIDIIPRRDLLLHYCVSTATANRYKWKNHFYEMKGDVGMSLHEKERNKKMPTPRHKVTHNPIPTCLFCFNMLFVCLL